MQFTRISEQQAYDALRDLNERFWTGTLEIPGLYELLERSGYDYLECVLAEVSPEGGKTSGGWIVGPQRRFLEFDLDPDDPTATSINSAPPPDPQKSPSAAESRLGRWLAWRYYEELLRSQHPELK